MRIGVTETMGSEDKFNKYTDWLKGAADGMECSTLSYKRDNLAEVDACDALLLTGGHDVDPRLYCGPVQHPTIIDVDRQRDSFERKAIDRAIQHHLPILGICRGLQLMNVHFGGTLIPDIQEAGFPNHRNENDTERRHNLIVTEGSLLSTIIGQASGECNTSHHQAVLKPGEGLRIAARSADGIIEALEYEEPKGRNYLLLVQWHPERMSGMKNPFSENIVKSFIAAIQLKQSPTTMKQDLL